MSGSKMLGGLLTASRIIRQPSGVRPIASTSYAAFADKVSSENTSPGEDKQEDSTADAKALEESRKVAEEFSNIESVSDHEKQGESKRDPEVKDKSGKSFPHQTDDQRLGRVASNTEGEAQVKTREYTPKQDSKLHEDKD